MVATRVRGFALGLLAVPLLVLLVHFSAVVTAAGNDTWIEIRSPHFVVVSNAEEKKARRTAGDFERIRAVFLSALEDTRDESETVVILAVKNEDSLKELLPAYWGRKGLDQTESSNPVSTSTSCCCGWTDEGALPTHLPRILPFAEEP